MARFKFLQEVTSLDCNSTSLLFIATYWVSPDWYLSTIPLLFLTVCPLNRSALRSYLFSKSHLFIHYHFSTVVWKMSHIFLLNWSDFKDMQNTSPNSLTFPREKLILKSLTLEQILPGLVPYSTTSYLK